MSEIRVQIEVVYWRRHFFQP